jgi:hypothetical protein
LKYLKTTPRKLKNFHLVKKQDRISLSDKLRGVGKYFTTLDELKSEQWNKIEDRVTENHEDLDKQNSYGATDENVRHTFRAATEPVTSALRNVSRNSCWMYC